MKNLKYLYVRNTEKRRDITVVSSIKDVGENEVEVSCAWTFRNNHDKLFKKSIGREIALNRLNNKDDRYFTSFIISKSEKNTFVICIKLLNKILENVNTPKKYLEDIEFEIGILQTIEKIKAYRKNKSVN